jgi:hypothetical protein
MSCGSLKNNSPPDAYALICFVVLVLDFINYVQHPMSLFSTFIPYMLDYRARSFLLHRQECFRLLFLD